MEEYIKTLICNYGFIIKGKGKMTGKKFADIIKMTFDCTDPRNQLYAELAERRLLSIEVSYGGRCNCRVTMSEK